MKHRLQNRLQATTDDFLGAAIGNSWHGQRKLHTGSVRLWDRLR